MRFAFVSTMDSVPWGGSEELWSRTALRLREAGHDVAASTVWWPTPSPKVLALKDRGIQILFHKQPQKSGIIPRVWRKIERKFGATDDASWLRAQQPDLVVISQGGFADGVAWMELCQQENLLFVAIIQCNSESWWPPDRSVPELSRVYSGATRVFGVSRHNLDLLENQIGQELPNSQVVWNPSNLRTETQTPWPEESGIWKIACVARLDPVAKGQDLLFQVLSLPHWRDRPIEVNLYGSGPCETTLQRLAKKLQLANVHFRGHVSDVNMIWAQNHLLILPSRFEGLPLTLLEAMVCGRPAVVTDVGGNAEMCIDGETGFVATAAAAVDIEQALERAWKQKADWQAMGANAHARAAKLIPKDQVGDFCRELLTCVAEKS